MDRIIGQFGGTQPGPLVIIIGAIHGNEPAGVRALQEVLQLLEQTVATHPNFVFAGKLIGLIGHRQAFAAGQRFLQQDLNRVWLPDTVARVLNNDPTTLSGEEREIYELHQAIQKAVWTYQPEKLVLLDLHTTSAAGGVFCIPTDETDSLSLARELHTPVILDLLEGISGTLLDFATAGYFTQNGSTKSTLGVAFEAGQHDDPLSVSRSVAAILHALRALGCTQATAADNRYDTVLRQYSAGLPRVTRLLHVHRVRPGDHFRMRPGYVNFQPIQAGEPLADDVHGPILAPYDGLMLMPLYQPLGTDGFFVVKPVA